MRTVTKKDLEEFEKLPSLEWSGYEVIALNLREVSEALSEGNVKGMIFNELDSRLPYKYFNEDDTLWCLVELNDNHAIFHGWADPMVDYHPMDRGED